MSPTCPFFAVDALNQLEIPFRALHHARLACSFRNMGNLHGALEHYNRALSIFPNYADVHINIGNILREMQDLHGAIQCCSRAIQINPADADAHNNLAVIYVDSGNIPKAIASFKTALELKPDLFKAHSDMAHCLQTICDWKDYKKGMARLVRIVQDQLEKKCLPSVNLRHAMMCPFTAAQRKAIAASHAKLCTERVTALNKAPYTYLQDLNASGGRLRIGYVSSDFRNHATSHLMQSIPGMHDRSRVEVFCYALRAADNTNFRRKIESEADHFVELLKIECNEEAADCINADGIHILLNMNGYTKDARNEVFALKPAPIQAMWLGYPGTSGADYMDYIITDRVTSPLDLADQYSEKLAYTPDTFFVGDHQQMFPHMLNRILLCFSDSRSGETVHWTFNGVDLGPLKQLSIQVEEQVRLALPSPQADTADGDPRKTKTTVIKLPASMVQTLQTMVTGNLQQCNIGNVLVQNGITTKQTAKTATGEEVPNCVILSARASYGLPENAVVFCNFGQPFKLNPGTFAMWMNILKKVPNSVLWLLRYSAEAEANILRTVVDLGLPAGRVVFSNLAPKEEHVRRGQLADVCLDTPLCNGHTTGMDVLWAGTPMVTLPGDTLASRVASSQLSCLGCPQLIARSPQHYVDIAVKLGTDMDYLRAVQAKVLVARSRSPLFNTQLYTQNLEHLYFRMWNRKQSQQPPDHLTEA